MMSAAERDLYELYRRILGSILYPSFIQVEVRANGLLTGIESITEPDVLDIELWEGESRVTSAVWSTYDEDMDNTYFFNWGVDIYPFAKLQGFRVVSGSVVDGEFALPYDIIGIAGQVEQHPTLRTLVVPEEDQLVGTLKFDINRMYTDAELRMSHCWEKRPA